MKRILLEGPAAEPVLLPEMKAHLRLDGDAEDALVGALIAAARVAVEIEIRRVLIAQTWRAIVERWPGYGVILPVVPALEIAAVRAVRGDGQTDVLTEDDYAFDAADGSVRLLASPAGVDRYEIDYVAGYGTSGLDVPQPLRQAVRMLATHWYEHRSSVIMGATSTATPHGFREMVAPYRRMVLC